VTSLQQSRMLLALIDGSGSGSGPGSGPGSAAAEAGFRRLVDDLEELRGHVLSSAARGRVLATATGDARALPPLEAALADVVSGLLAASPPAAGAAAAPRFGLAWAPPRAGAGDPPLTAGLALPFTPLAALRLASAGAGAGAAGSAEAGARAAEAAEAEEAAGGDARPVGIVVPTQVNYCVRSARLSPPPQSAAAAAEGAAPGALSEPPLSDAAPAGAARARFAAPGGFEVVANALRTGHLWDKVRVQGGAYGGFCSVSAQSGALTFASYRDPRLGATLRDFDAAAAALERGAAGGSGAAGGGAAAAPLREDLRKAVLSSIGAADAPLAPAERGAASTGRYLGGVTQAMRARRRAEMLAAGPEDARAFAAAMAEAWARGGGAGARTAVVGGEAAIAAAAAEAAAAGAPAWRVFRPLGGGGGK